MVAGLAVLSPGRLVRPSDTTAGLDTDEFVTGKVGTAVLSMS